MKKNNTKKAFLTSLLALTLSSSMLVGSTFAWFTDSVTSTGNVIQTGTLDVEMEWKDAAKDEAYKTVDDKPIFTNDKWEPGYLEAKNIKITNKGSLALKYQLSIVPNGEVSKLADVIDVYYAASEIAVENRDMTGLTKLGTLAQVIDKAYAKAISNTIAGSLESGKEATVTIVFKMQETAGNEYQDLKIGGKDGFSVQLLATQYTYEEDSIDDQYDADAHYGTYVELNKGDDLMAAMKNAKAGLPLTIKLNGDVVWITKGGQDTQDVTLASSITIDGNGHTLTVTGNGVSPLGDKETSMTLKNMTVVDKTVSYDESAWELSYLEMGGAVLNCEKVNFTDPIMVESQAANFTGCTFAGYTDQDNNIDMYGVWMLNGDANFTNCTFTGTRGMKICDKYEKYEVGTVVIDGCTFVNLTEKPGIAIDDYHTQDMKITIKNSYFINCAEGKNADGIVYGNENDKYIYETDNTVPTLLENNTVTNADNAIVSTQAALDDALSNQSTVSTVYLTAGEYTLPTLGNKEGMTIIGAEGAVIGGENVETGFDRNFGQNTTIKNVTFSGSTNGVRWSYAKGGTTTFENCTFAGDSTYGFHVDSVTDGKPATYIFNDCTFIGFNAFSSQLTEVIFNDCTFLSNGRYGNTNIWSVGRFNNCTWGDNTSVDLANNAKLYFNGVEESYYHEFIGSAESLVAFAESVKTKDDGTKGKTWKGQKVLLVNDIELANVDWNSIGDEIGTNATYFQGTFDGQGYTISNLTNPLFANINGTVQNLTIDTATIVDEGARPIGVVGYSIYNGGLVNNVTVKNATVVGNGQVGGIVGSIYGKITNCTVEDSSITAIPTTDNGDKVGGIVGLSQGDNNSGVISGNKVINVTITGYRDIGGIAGAADAEIVTNNTVINVKLIVDVTTNGYGHADAGKNCAAILGRALDGNTVSNSNTATNVTVENK